MITSHNSTDGRVEVKFGLQRTEADTVIVSRDTVTYPVNGKGVQWSKAERTSEVLFEIEADLIPELLGRLGLALQLEKGDWA